MHLRRVDSFHSSYGRCPVTGLFLSWLIGSVLFLFPARAQNEHVLNAVYISGEISVDGRMDEADWKNAQPASGFVQLEPSEGATASFGTEVAVLYGPDHLYVGVRLFDNEPAAILRTLGRRDEINRADWFLVALDSYLDRKTAYVFGVNAAGVQYDAMRSGGEGDIDGPNDDMLVQGLDASWDAIWASGVQVTADGWSAELRIPYSMLRFAAVPEASWGIHFTRRIPRLGETDEWPLVPRTERNNMVALFGQLRDLRNVSPRHNVQVRPYTMSHTSSREKELPRGVAYDQRFEVGGDLKIGFGPNLTLDATLNPDFGQVESDPAVLNLTAFETFYEERRPFFVEGSQIYEFAAGPGQMLYTRRIGARHPILGAAKLSGRSARGLSYGVLGATTGNNLDIAQNFGAVRFIQETGQNSTFGGILTYFDEGWTGTDARSVSGGTDWDLRLLDNRYGIEGFMAVTYRRNPIGGEEGTGFGGKVWTRKRQGAWSGFVGVDLYSDRFDPNDVGQFQENDFGALLVSIDHEINAGRPFGRFQRANSGFFFIQRRSYREGLDMGQQISLNTSGTLRGFQQVELGIEVEDPFGAYDLYETRGLGPWKRPASYAVGVEYGTDERRLWKLRPEVGVGFQKGGGSEVELELEADWNVGSRLTLKGMVGVARQNNVLAWSSNESLKMDDPGWEIGTSSLPPSALGAGDYIGFDAGGSLAAALSGMTPYDADGGYFTSIFGKRDTRTLDLTLRSDVTLTPNLSIQFYSQLFLARGRYDDFELLVDRDRLVPFDGYPKRDEFSLNNLTVNTVLRWEYRPGSTLYVVWTQGRSGNDRLNPLAPWGRSPFHRTLDRQVSDTFDLFARNTFIFKLNYTILR